MKRRLSNEKRGYNLGVIEGMRRKKVVRNKERTFRAAVKQKLETIVTQKIKAELVAAKAFTEKTAVKRSELAFNTMTKVRGLRLSRFNKMIPQITKNNDIHVLTGFQKEKRYYIDKK